MQDNLKYLEKEIQKAQSNATGARQQAQAERFKAGQRESDNGDSDVSFYLQAAEALEQRAEHHEKEIQEFEARKAQVEARVNELKSQRETINRETLEKITAIDRELESLQGSMSV